MRRERAREPSPPEIPEDLTPWPPADSGPGAELVEVELVGCQLAQTRAQRLSVRCSALRHVDLSHAHLRQLSGLDVSMHECNLANLQAPAASLIRLRASGCRLTGVVVSETLLRDATFTGCQIDLASLTACRLQQVTFEDCLITQTDFLEAMLVSVRFHGCDLSQADFRGARLMRCEFRGSDLTGARGIDRLAGSAMPWADIIAQAGVWANSLGIEVLDDECPE